MKGAGSGRCLRPPLPRPLGRCLPPPFPLPPSCPRSPVDIAQHKGVRQGRKQLDLGGRERGRGWESRGGGAARLRRGRGQSGGERGPPSREGDGGDNVATSESEQASSWGSVRSLRERDLEGRPSRLASGGEGTRPAPRITARAIRARSPPPLPPPPRTSWFALARSLGDTLSRRIFFSTNVADLPWRGTKQARRGGILPKPSKCCIDFPPGARSATPGPSRQGRCSPSSGPNASRIAVPK